MNVIGSVEGPEVRVELKYCERCGGLFLRRPAEDRVYCAGCTVHLLRQMDPGEILGNRKFRERRRTRKARTGGGELVNTGHIRRLQGVAELGVWA